jgi:hypothetical protein
MRQPVTPAATPTRCGNCRAPGFVVLHDVVVTGDEGTCEDQPLSPSLKRILARSHDAGLLEVLVGLPGADLTSLLMEVARRRCQSLTAPEVLASYRRDRFVRPSAGSLRDLHRVENILLNHLPDDFVCLPLSPLSPKGAHSAVAGVDQNRVLTTLRGTEVGADPTNGLALEAAGRRRQALSQGSGPDEVHLATIQRVVRAQNSGRDAAAHFSILGLVSAGRHASGLPFERGAVGAHLAALTRAVQAVDAPRLRLELTDFTAGTAGAVCDQARRVMARFDRAEVVDRPDREGGHNYYERFCFKLNVLTTDGAVEIADGGFVNWSQRLLGDSKERMLISGLGVERLALAAPA